MSARSQSALLGITLAAALGLPVEAWSQPQVVNAWNLYSAEDSDGRPQFSLSYMDPVDKAGHPDLHLLSP